MIKHTLSIALLALTATLAAAADADPEAGFFGRIDTTAFPRPELTSRIPVEGPQSDRSPGATQRAALRSPQAPVLLHVRPGEEHRWAAHCSAYGACGVPVLFVSESWFRDVYLPATSSEGDGREQRYRLLRFERNQREQRHRDPS
jgi:hypothetical protein